MKRHGNLFERIASFENLYLASRKARKGKRLKEDVMQFEQNIEEQLFILREDLLSRTYLPGAYREFTIYERKKRLISAAPYRDRVVHHALCNIIEPLFEPTFIFDSYACRKEKGTHKAVDRFTEYCGKCAYVLKTDIKKYFATIDHAILFKKIEKKIKCRDTLWLIKTIIDGSNDQERICDYFPGDDLFTPFVRRKGIPIGNLTSQFFANIYLNDLDHFIKEKLRCKCYIRYVDDLSVFDDSKRRLWQLKGEIETYLEKDRLNLHRKKTYVSPVATGVDHLGYRISPTHRLLRKDTGMNFRKKLKLLVSRRKDGLLSAEKLNAVVQSWLGHAKHADARGLTRSIFDWAGILH